MERFARLAHAGLAWLFVVGILVQVFLAGLAIFSDPATWQSHIAFGYAALGLLALGVLVSSIATRPPRNRFGWVALLFVDYVVQTVLPNLKTTAPTVSALHPVNALILFGLAIVVARKATADLGSARGAQEGAQDTERA